MLSGKNDVHCYYEPCIGDARPDFVLISSALGVLILEVKDYKEDYFLEARSSGPWLLSVAGVKEQPVQNPFDQLYEYWKKILSRLHLQKQEIRRIAVFPQIHETSDAGSSIISVKPSRIDGLIFKEDLASQEKFQERMNRIVPNNLALTQERMRFLRGNLIPTSRLPSFRQTRMFDYFQDRPVVRPHQDKVDGGDDEKSLNQSKDVHVVDQGAEDMLQLLDEEQEDLAQNLGGGHRIFFGVAGSGKTILLIARARHLALEHPDWRILVLCYNKNLAKAIERKLVPQEYDADIFISNFHKWAKEIITGAGSKYRGLYFMKFREYEQDKNTFFDEIVPQILSRVVENEDMPKYDAIFIDEAQDFAANWFSPLTALLNPKTDSLLITCDGLQGIYARKRFYWSDVGIKARGRTVKLRKAYRNPEEIGSLAQDMLPQHLVKLLDTSDEFNSTEEFIRQGGRVELEILSSEASLHAFMIEKLKASRARGWDVMILFRRNVEKNVGPTHPFIELMDRKGFSCSSVGAMSSSGAAGGRKNGGSIFIATPQGSKGLEADVVIIPEVHAYRTPDDLQLLYVAMTRATRELVLLSPLETEVTNRIRTLLQNKERCDE